MPSTPKPDALPVDDLGRRHEGLRAVRREALRQAGRPFQLSLRRAVAEGT